MKMENVCKLEQSTVTFGQYRGQDVKVVMKDRSYCRWLIQQDWFQKDYEFLYNLISNYNPKDYFIVKSQNLSQDSTQNSHPQFIDIYEFFNLCPPANIQIDLTSDELICYKYYVETVDNLRNKIQSRIDNGDDNIYSVKAPVKWLQQFEQSCNLPRAKFKEFMLSYDLPNITSIVEDIKKEGGIEYKGAKSFLIAKQRSKQQEAYWENILKTAYKEDICSQFKYNDCIFDFLCIPTKTIFEAKLGLKDLCASQYKKYRIVLNEYRIVYLIGTDCVIHIAAGVIYTTAIGDYEIYQQEIPLMKKPSKFDLIFKDFKIVVVEDISSLFGYSKSVTHS